MSSQPGPRSHPSRLLCALAACLLSASTLAQHPAAAQGAPDADVVRIHAALAALGRTWDPQVLAATAGLYTDLHRRHPLAGITRIQDVSYGPDPRQKLDEYFPEQGFEALGPVIIFLHGGTGTGGDKLLPGTDGLVYANVAKLAARGGGVGINVDYRQMPDAKWPAGADDVRRVIEWAHANVARRGGDPDSILVVANGEGALHLATYLFHQASQPAGGPGIAGAILVSGTLAPDPAAPAARHYFGRHGDARLPLHLLDSYQGKAVPMLLMSAALDPVQSGMTELKDKLCRKYASCPSYVELADHNHVSAVMSLDSPDTSAMMPIVRFYHSVVRK